MPTELIVAMDLHSAKEAENIVDNLVPEVRFFKVGSTLFTRAGKRVVEYIKSKGAGVFLDLKFFDIPHQVQNACRAAGEIGVDMLTVHAIGGREMIRAALEGIKEAGSETLVLGVTILTSMNDTILKNEMRINKSSDEMVSFLAKQAYEEGLRGFVCSPFEIEALKNALPDITLVTPGVRMAGEQKGDQKRVMTPGEATRHGSDYLVMGRSVYQAPDMKAAVREIRKEIEAVRI